VGPEVTFGKSQIPNNKWSEIDVFEKMRLHEPELERQGIFKLVASLDITSFC